MKPAAPAAEPNRFPGGRSRLLVLGAYAGCGLLTLVFAHFWRNFLFDYDTRFWFIGGVMWLDGLSPYAHDPFHETWQRTFGKPGAFPQGFVYPGTLLPVSLLLGAFPWEIARWLMRGLNAATWVGTLLLLRRHLLQHPGGTATLTTRDFWVGVAAITPGASMCLYQGQVALLVALGLTLTWIGLSQHRHALAIVGIPLALIKPQLALLPLIFLLGRYWHARAWWGLGIAGALVLAVFAWTSPSQFLSDFQDSLAAHMRQEFNHPHRYDGLSGLVGPSPLARPVLWLGIALGIAGAVALVRTVRHLRDPTVDLRALQIVLVLTALTIPIHRYDLAIYSLLLATAWVLGSTGRALLLLGLVVAQGSVARVTIWWMKPGVNSTWVEWMDAAAQLAAIGAVVQFVLLVAWWRRDRRRGMLAT